MNNITAFFKKAEHDQGFREWTVAVSASVLLHIGLCIMIVIFTGHNSHRSTPFRSIDVDLSFAPPPKGKTEAPPEKPAKPKQKKAVKKVSKPVSKKKQATGLKQKKTEKKVKKEPKPRDMINDAINRLEKDLAKTPKPEPDPISERLKQMARDATQEPAKTEEPVGTPSGTGEKGNPAYEASLEDRYRYNVGMEIRENWAFSENLAAGKANLETRVEFEVLPDGEIRGVTITRYSGNDYMDSSATMAILKSSPVRPFPPGLNKPFVTVKLRFTPEGLN